MKSVFMYLKYKRNKFQIHKYKNEELKKKSNANKQERKIFLNIFPTDFNLNSKNN